MTMMELDFHGVAEDEVVIEHERQAKQDDDGAAPGEFFSHSKDPSLRSG